ncbi:hypothetical protein DL769_001280 [Monosporascus sp. CRB-8-3]|nr:hypothetical protein DL769_001280 [Monosporascus sp. CRB-8-3]
MYMRRKPRSAPCDPSCTLYRSPDLASEKRALFVSVDPEAISLLEPVAERLASVRRVAGSTTYIVWPTNETSQNAPSVRKNSREEKETRIQDDYEHYTDEELARHQHGIQSAPTVSPCQHHTLTAAVNPEARASRAAARLQAGSPSPSPSLLKRPARVVHGAHGADGASSGRGRVRYEHRLEPMRCDVADEWHIRVSLSRVPRAPEREPPPQQRWQRQQPEGAREQREESEAALRKREEGRRKQAGPEREAAVRDKSSDLDSLRRNRVDCHVTAKRMEHYVKGAIGLLARAPYASKVRPIDRRFNTEYNTLMAECMNGKH